MGGELDEWSELENNASCERSVSKGVTSCEEKSCEIPADV